MKTYTEDELTRAIETADNLAYCAALNFKNTGTGLKREERLKMAITSANIKIGDKVKYMPTGEEGEVWNIIDEKYMQVDFGKGRFTNSRTSFYNCKIV
jgi:dsDNA-specific endonuclease/ATPase MutS2